MIPDRLTGSPSPVREASLGCEAGPSYEEAMAAMMAEPLDYYESSDEVSLQFCYHMGVHAYCLLPIVQHGRRPHLLSRSEAMRPLTSKFILYVQRLLLENLLTCGCLSSIST